MKTNQYYYYNLYKCECVILRCNFTHKILLHFDDVINNVTDTSWYVLSVFQSLNYFGKLTAKQHHVALKLNNNNNNKNDPYKWDTK